METFYLLEQARASEKSYIYRVSDGLVYFAGFLIRAKIKPEYDAEFVFQNTLSESYEKICSNHIPALWSARSQRTRVF